MDARSVSLTVSLALLASFLSACTADPVTVYKPIEVSVPVYVRPTPPAELLMPYRPSTLPTFISPLDPAAKAALSETDLNHLKTLLRTLTSRDEAWRAWAVPPETPVRESVPVQ